MNLAMMAERLPRESFWSAAGIGRFQFSMNALGYLAVALLFAGATTSIVSVRAQSRDAGPRVVIGVVAGPQLVENAPLRSTDLHFTGLTTAAS